MQTEYELRQYGGGWAIEDADGSIVARFPLKDASRAVGELERLNAQPTHLVTRRPAHEHERDAG